FANAFSNRDVKWIVVLRERDSDCRLLLCGGRQRADAERDQCGCHQCEITGAAHGRHPSLSAGAGPGCWRPGDKKSPACKALPEKDGGPKIKYSSGTEHTKTANNN